MNRRFAFSLTVALAIVLAGCLTARLTPEHLPDRPIAFLHWADRDAKKRADIFEKMSEVPPLPDDEDKEALEELQIRAYLRGDEMIQVHGQLEKHPSRLMLLWPRTGEMERIEAAPPNAMPLAFSRDGERLLLASSHRENREHLYEYNLKRRDLRPVTFGGREHPRGDYSDAAGQGGSEVIALRLSRLRDSMKSRMSVHRIGVGGRGGLAVAERVPPGTLRIVPEGDRIVYEQIVERERRDGPTVFESWIATRSLTPGASEDRLLRGREPVLTPDGDWVVFASYSTAGYRLRRMRLDGTSRVPIGAGTTEERMPAVSPDGEFVAFVKHEYGRRRLAVRRFDGKGERLLVTDGWSEFPVW